MEVDGVRVGTIRHAHENLVAAAPADGEVPQPLDRLRRPWRQSRHTSGTKTMATTKYQHNSAEPSFQ